MDPRDLEGEAFVGFSDVPHVLPRSWTIIERNGIDLQPSHRIDNFAMGISLVASTRGVALLPTYVEPLLPLVGGEPAAEGRAADDRPCDWLSPRQYLAGPEGIPGACRSIGLGARGVREQEVIRTGRRCDSPARSRGVPSVPV